MDPTERPPLWRSDLKKTNRQKQKERGNSDENPGAKRFTRWRRRRPVLPAEPKKIEGEKGNKPPIIVLLVNRPFAAELFAKNKPKRADGGNTQRGASETAVALRG